MKLFKLFFITTSITLILTLAQVLGYDVFESLVIMLMISFFTLAASVRIDIRNDFSRSSSIDIGKDIVPRLETIEKTCNDTYNHVTKPDLEQTMRKHNENITYLLDRMAKKTLELEDKLTKFGNSLVDSLSTLRERVNELEERKQNGESFSLGEIVYVEEDKQNT